MLILLLLSGPPAASSRTVILLRALHLKGSLLARWEQEIKDIRASELLELYAMVDVTKGSVGGQLQASDGDETAMVLDRLLAPERVVRFQERDIREHYPLSHKLLNRTLSHGKAFNMLFHTESMSLFANKTLGMHFDHLWIVEEDVAFTGGAARYWFEHHLNNTADLLIVETPEKQRRGSGGYSKATPQFHAMFSNARYRAGEFLVRMSRPLVQRLHNLCLEGVSVFSEDAAPTVAMAQNSTFNISVVDPSLIGRARRNQPGKPGISSKRWQQILNSEVRTGTHPKCWHPVKH